MFGIALIGLLAVSCGVWAATTPIAGAVIASGLVVVENNIKKVQHPSGGIVAEILVKNGDRVSAGDVVLRLDETQARANLGIIASQLVQLTGRKARLEAERDQADAIRFPVGFFAQRGGGGHSRRGGKAPVRVSSRGQERTGRAAHRAHRPDPRGDQGSDRAARCQEHRGGADDRGDRAARAVAQEGADGDQPHPGGAARSDQAEGRMGRAGGTDGARARPDQRDGAADPRARPDHADRGDQGAARDGGAHGRADRAQDRRRGPAQAHPPARAADRHRARSRRAHGGRRDRRRRDGDD